MNHKRIRTLLGIFTLLVVCALAVGVIARVRAAPLRATTITFTGEELLGRPEDTSITINIVPASTIEYFYDYGTVSATYSYSTTLTTATGGQPSEVVISGLSPNTQYYYRMRYHLPGETDWVVRTEHSFWTQRAQGSTFIFTVTSDAHGNAGSSTMTNIYNEDPDFNVDLGDTFMVDNTTSQTAVNNAYLAFREPTYFDRIGCTAPIFLSSGNHENEEGWNLDDTPFSIAQGSIQARKLFYPTPISDTFYSGNADPLSAISVTLYGDQHREDYYAWTWGDALFVVIDEFQYTMQNPYGSAAGEGSDDPATGDQWNWTLGAQQYQWLKQTLQNSNAKYKFMFSHQMVGGITRAIAGVNAGYVRGGAEAAAYFEWGGLNADGTNGFAAHRDTGVFTPTIQQMMVDNHVSAYFHGHDHQYCYERRDNIVYQEVPSPSMSGSGFSGIYTEGNHGTYNTIKILPNSGHLRITITPDLATVDYIASSSGSVNYSYTITPTITGPTHVLTTTVSPSGGGTTNPSVGQHSYAVGAVVPVTAQANAGYIFSSWSGACTGSGSCSVTMDADKSVTANFAVAPSYTLTAGNDGNGSVTLNPSGGSYYSGTTVTLTPAPGSGKAFIGWVGANASDIINTSGVYTIVMNGNKSVTANFYARPCTVWSRNADEDTYLTAANTTYNYGGSPGLEVESYSFGATYYRKTALLRWTSFSPIATDATINSVTITLQVTDTSTYAYPLYDVRRAWVEGSNRGSAGSGASWTYWDAGSSAWTTAGAASTTYDRYNTNLWNSTTTSFSASGSRPVTLNSSGLGIVQGWVAGTGTNNGAIIQYYGGASSQSLGFYSSEGTTPPKMEINYCAGNNHAPGAELVWPGDQYTGTNISPTLQITATDSDSNRVNVSFYGAVSGTMGSTLSQEAASLAGLYLGTAYAVSNTEHAAVVWPDLGTNTWYQWYVVVSDGAITTTVPAAGYWTFQTGSPTAARLTSLGANPGLGGILLRWDTASELGDLGFHVWRASSANGQRERLTTSLIPSQAPGSAATGHYEFVDATARAGVTYYYWLELVDVSGATQLFGPVSARASLNIKVPPPRN